MESRFTTHVRKVFADRVDIATDAARAIRATLDTPGWRLIEQVVTAEVDDVDRRSEFHPDRVIDQAVYAARHGYRTGLLASREAADELVRYADLMEERFDAEKQASRVGQA